MQRGALGEEECKGVDPAAALVPCDSSCARRSFDSMTASPASTPGGVDKAVTKNDVTDALASLEAVRQRVIGDSFNATVFCRDHPTFPRPKAMLNARTSATLESMQDSADSFVAAGSDELERAGRAGALQQAILSFHRQLFRSQAAWMKTLLASGQHLIAVRGTAPLLDAEYTKRRALPHDRHKQVFDDLEARHKAVWTELDSPKTLYAMAQRARVYDYALLSGGIVRMDMPDMCHPGAVISNGDLSWAELVKRVKVDRRHKQLYEQGRVCAMPLTCRLTWGGTEVKPVAVGVPWQLHDRDPRNSFSTAIRTVAKAQCTPPCGAKPGRSCPSGKRPWYSGMCMGAGAFCAMLVVALVSYAIAQGQCQVNFADILEVEVLTVLDKATFGDDIFFQRGHNFSVGPTVPWFDVQSPARFAGTFDAPGLHADPDSQSVSVDAGLSVHGQARFSDGVVISGPALLSSPVSVTSTLHVYGTATLGDNAEVGGELVVDKGSTFHGGVTVVGGVSASSSSVAGVSSVGSLTVASGMKVTGGTTADTLHVTGPATFASLSATGISCATATVENAVLQAATVSGHIDAASIDAAGPVQLAGSLTVVGTTTLGGLQCKGNLSVMLATATASLDVSGRSTLHSVTVASSLAADDATLTTASVDTLRAVSMQATKLRVSGPTTLGNTTVAGNVTADTVLTAHLLAGSVATSSVTTHTMGEDLVLSPSGSGSVVLGPGTQLQLATSPATPPTCTASQRGKLYVQTGDPAVSSAGDQVLVCVRGAGTSADYQWRALAFTA